MNDSYYDPYDYDDEDEYRDDDEDEGYEGCDVCGGYFHHDNELHIKHDAMYATVEYYLQDKVCCNCGERLVFDTFYSADETCLTDHARVSCFNCELSSLVLMDEDYNPVALYYGTHWMTQSRVAEIDENGLQELPF